MDLNGPGRAQRRDCRCRTLLVVDVAVTTMGADQRTQQLTFALFGIVAASFLLGLACWWIFG
jgi:hypothetical protein